MPASVPAQRWIERGRVDLDSAEILRKHQGHPDTVCFLAHQAIEKSLKAFIALRGGRPRKLHDLVVLAAECAALDPGFGVPGVDYRNLNRYYIETRYPTLVPPNLTPQEADLALNAARAVWGNVAALASAKPP
jgi:HEPN domain-containing protein